jgi:hypothetical protein
MDTAVEKSQKYGMSTLLSTVRRTRATRHVPPTSVHKLRQQLTCSFTGSHMGGVLVVPIATVVGVTVVAAGAAIVFGYFLLVREEGGHAATSSS